MLHLPARQPACCSRNAASARSCSVRCSGVSLSSGGQSPMPSSRGWPQPPARLTCLYLSPAHAARHDRDAVLTRPAQRGCHLGGTAGRHDTARLAGRDRGCLIAAVGVHDAGIGEYPAVGKRRAQRIQVRRHCPSSQVPAGPHQLKLTGLHRSGPDISGPEVSGAARWPLLCRGTAYLRDDSRREQSAKGATACGSEESPASGSVIARHREAAGGQPRSSQLPP